MFLTGARLEGCVLKGGVNLRYFFGSVRYSNDLDLNVPGPADFRLGDAVDAVLKGPALRKVLAIPRVGIDEGSISRPKQTDTTRRWRLALVDLGNPRATPVRAKIELSARGDDSDDREVEAVPPSVVRPYGLVQPTVAHYRLTAAIEQKIAALALRSETKARDVFDLDLLFRLGDRLETRAQLVAEWTEPAADRAIELTDADFAGKSSPSSIPTSPRRTGSRARGGGCVTRSPNASCRSRRRAT